MTRATHGSSDSEASDAAAGLTRDTDDDRQTFVESRLSCKMCRQRKRKCCGGNGGRVRCERCTRLGFKCEVRNAAASGNQRADPNLLQYPSNGIIRQYVVEAPRIPGASQHPLAPEHHRPQTRPSGSRENHQRPSHLGPPSTEMHSPSVQASVDAPWDSAVPMLLSGARPDEASFSSSPLPPQSTLQAAAHFARFNPFMANNVLVLPLVAAPQCVPPRITGLQIFPVTSSASQHLAPRGGSLPSINYSHTSSAFQAAAAEWRPASTLWDIHPDPAFGKVLESSGSHSNSYYGAPTNNPHLPDFHPATVSFANATNAAGIESSAAYYPTPHAQEIPYPVFVQPPIAVKLRWSSEPISLASPADTHSPTQESLSSGSSMATHADNMSGTSRGSSCTTLPYPKPMDPPYKLSRDLQGGNLADVDIAMRAAVLHPSERAEHGCSAMRIDSLLCESDKEVPTHPALKSVKVGLPHTKGNSDEPR